jgi:hypothetical protein
MQFTNLFAVLALAMSATAAAVTKCPDNTKAVCCIGPDHNNLVCTVVALLSDCKSGLKTCCSTDAVVLSILPSSTI